MFAKPSTGSGRSVTRTFLALLFSASALVSTAALAQDAAAPSQNATVNLIRALVKKGILTQPEADGMIAQAEAEASQARATASAAQTAVAAAEPASATPGTSVRYVPQFVRDEIKQEVQAGILADARKEGLVAPDAVPEWVRGIKISGDMRVRVEGRYFDDGNAFNFVNVGAINNGAPYNTDPSTNPNSPPIVNSYRDRNYMRLRARLGIDATIDNDLTAHLRIATGSDDSPVSTNQTLGGFFAKKDLWLDQAYLDFRPIAGAHILAGRMANPFRMSELVWDDDINLDGVAASYGRDLTNRLSGYVLGGAFPLDYIPDDFPSDGLASTKTSSAHNKWLYAAQIGAAWRVSQSTRSTFDLAYYDYRNVEGDLSPSCINTSQYCLTDYSRPGFLQKGNTLFALRDNVTLDPTNTAAPQYYGLASQFRVLAAAVDVDWAFGRNKHLNLAGHISTNLAYDESDILKRGFNANTGLSQIVNNNETCSVDLVGGLCPAGKSVFKSGGTAWLIRATLGNVAINQAGDWNLTATYRSIDPDALLDAFTDSDFRLGGTNTRGWTIGGAYGLRRNTSLQVRWMNGEEVSGPPFRADLVQADLNVAF